MVDVYDGTHQTPKYQKSGIMFLSVENIKTLKSNKYISKEDFEQDFKVYPQKGDILMTRIGDIGTANMTQINDPVAYYVSLALIKPFKINSNFLTFSISSDSVQRDLWKRTLHVAFPKKINKNEIGKIQISFPNESEQISIGKILILVSECITLQQQQLNLYIKLKKGLLQKLFPKNGEMVPEIRFADFTGDWEQHKLGTLIVPFNKTTTINNQYPVLTSSRKGLFFQTDYYDGNQIASKNNIGYNIVPRGYFTYRHMSDDLIFKFNINNLVDNGIVSTLYPVFTVNNKLDSEYLKYQLNDGEEFKRFAITQKQGGSRTYMYLSKLKKLLLTIPNLDEQVEISNFLDSLNSVINLQQEKLNELEALKKYLLQKLFI